MRNRQSGEKDSEPKANVAVEMFGGANAIVDVAFDRLTDEINQMQRKWLWVADIFQLTVDMAYEKRIVLRRGSSISKAIELCEVERGLPGHSQLRAAWSEFRDVAHLLAAAARFAHIGRGEDSVQGEAYPEFDVDSTRSRACTGLWPAGIRIAA